VSTSVQLRTQSFSFVKEYKPKIAKKPGRSHSATGKPAGRPPSVKTCLEQIRSDVAKYTRDVVSKYPEDVQRYVL
jgi:hypothetical protein